MMRFVALAVAMLAASAVRAAEVPDALRSAVAAEISDLNAYVRVVTGYTSTALPRVMFRTPAEINRMAYGDKYDHQDEHCDVQCALAVTLGGTIFLGTNYRPGPDDYILAHELVHFQQFEAGKEYPCVGEAEPEAYGLQDKFVADTGRGEKSDAMLVFMLQASCEGGW